MPIVKYIPIHQSPKRFIRYILQNGKTDFLKYLTIFDNLLKSRGHKFVRCADDCNIYVKSQRATERVITNCVKILEEAVKLKVNGKKLRQAYRSG